MSRRALRLAACFGLVLAIGAPGCSFVWKRLVGLAGDPVWTCEEPCALHQIVWTGDTLLGDAAEARLAEHGYGWPFEHIRGLLRGDAVIGNAEGPITVRTRWWDPEARWSYNTAPAAAHALAEAGFSAMSLANNHAYDRGVAGLWDTQMNLAEAGVHSFGAGMNEDEAWQPLWLDTAHGRLAVFGMTTRGWAQQAARGSRPGAAVVTQANARAARERARAEGARWLAAYVHWGRTYEDVHVSQRRVATLLAEEGFDFVVGHGPHVHQGVERIGDTWVLYSIGNLAFTTYGRFGARGLPGYGLVVRSYLGERGFVAIELRCILTDYHEVHFQPRSCPPERARAVLEELGTSVVLRGDVGVIHW